MRFVLLLQAVVAVGVGGGGGCCLWGGVSGPLLGHCLGLHSIANLCGLGVSAPEWSLAPLTPCGGSFVLQFLIGLRVPVVTAFVGLHYCSGLLAGSWGWVRAALGGTDCFAALLPPIMYRYRASVCPTSVVLGVLHVGGMWLAPVKGILLLNETKVVWRTFFFA